MTKKYRVRHNLKGGFLDSLGQTFSNLGTSISRGASNMWTKTKKATGMDNSTYTPSSYSSSSYNTPNSNYSQDSSSTYSPSSSSSSTYAQSPYSSSTYTRGGKRLRKGLRKPNRSRTMKRGGNFIANEPINSLASRAGNFTGGLTARVHNLVGGKKRRSRRTRR